MDRLPADFEPQTEEDFAKALADPWWRMNNLYWIKIKEDDEDSADLISKFRMNEAQEKLANNLWYRNIIPKARQLGFTTWSCIYALDCCLFTNNFNAGIVAHTDGAAKKIFREKVLFAYERLPDAIKQRITLTKKTGDELVFSNGSNIQVSTSMRSGTLQFLHISEFGKICARFPHRAVEIVTGSLPTVPQNGVVIIESTAEGDTGSFYDMTMRALEHHNSGRKLNKKQYRLHFYPWFDGPDYRMDPKECIISEKDHEYFDQLEAELGIELDMWQRAWYVSTRDEDFSGDEQKMWQEYPSTVEECFKVSSEGCYYTKQIARTLKEGRRRKLPKLDNKPCLTFWDIGNTDGTAIWVVQIVGNEIRLIDFFEMWGEPYNVAANWLLSRGYIYQEHFLPHDADHHRQGKTANESPKEMLEDLMPGHEFTTVPRIEDIGWGIQQTRDVFQLLHFDEEGTKEGWIHVKAYHKKWSPQQERWIDEPEKRDGHSEAADGLRQLGQAYASGMINASLPDVRNSEDRERDENSQSAGSSAWRVA